MSTRLLPNRVSHLHLGCPAKSSAWVPEPQVLAAEVVVRSPEGELSEELQNEVYRAIRNGRTTTRSQLQEDINDLCDGLFSDVRAQPGIPLWACNTLWCSPTRFYVTSKCKPMQV